MTDSRKSRGWLGWLAAALVGVGLVVLVLSLFMAYVGRVLVRDDTFANRVTESLDDPAVADYLALRITDVVIRQQPDLTALRPILVVVTRSVVTSAPFHAMARPAIRRVHQAVMSRTAENILLAVPDVGVLIRESLESVGPAEAERVPDRLEPVLPLSRFLPPIEDGTVAAWLAEHASPSSWVLDPFGFSPRLPVEAARAGYRVLVTVNNPITRFLLELSADPPTEADFKAALVDLAASKRGEERLETHLQSLYLTRCEQCGREIQATALVWKEGADAPFARVYECPECGDRGQKDLSGEDVDCARRQGAADGLHRSRALERVATKDDPERAHVSASCS